MLYCLGEILIIFSVKWFFDVRDIFFLFVKDKCNIGIFLKSYIKLKSKILYKLKLGKWFFIVYFFLI